MNTFNVELTDKQWFNIMSGMIYALTINRKGVNWVKVNSKNAGKTEPEQHNYLLNYSQVGYFKLKFKNMDGYDTSNAENIYRDGQLWDSAAEQISNVMSWRNTYPGYFIDIQDRYLRQNSYRVTFRVTLDTLGYPVTALEGDIPYNSGIVSGGGGPKQNLTLQDIQWLSSNPFAYRAHNPEVITGNTMGLGIYLGNDTPINGVYDLFDFTVGIEDTTLIPTERDLYNRMEAITFGKHRCYCLNNYQGLYQYSKAIYNDTDNKYGIMHRIKASEQPEQSALDKIWSYICAELKGFFGVRGNPRYSIDNLGQYGEWLDVDSDEFKDALGYGYARIRGVLYCSEARTVYIGYGSKENPGATIKLELQAGDNLIDIKIPLYYETTIVEEGSVYINLCDNADLGESNTDIYFKPGTIISVDNLTSPVEQLPESYEYDDIMDISDTVDIIVGGGSKDKELTIEETIEFEDSIDVNVEGGGGDDDDPETDKFTISDSIETEVT